MDADIADVVSKLAMGSGSPAQMVQHSPDLRNMLKAICAERRPHDKLLASLRAAKHRFESFQKPLGRSIRLFDCLHILMVDIANCRRDKQGDRAMEWLAWVTATPRHLLLAAMLADAADEASALTRFSDVEEMDPSALSEAVADFLGRAEALFGLGRQCLSCSGYTQIALKFLEKPFVRIARGKVFTLPELKSTDVEWCLDHLRGWLKLAQAEVRAEFPTWEVAQSFRVFNVAAVDSGSMSEHVLSSYFECLAKVSGIDCIELRAQFDVYKGFVLRELRSSKCTVKEAWQRAIDQVQQRHSSTRRMYPDSALRPALYRYLAFCGSSSGVEQTFTQAQIAVSDRQLGAGRLLELAYTKIKVDASRDSVLDVVKRAQSVWANLYGIVKKSGGTRKPRIDRGVKRKHADRGEASFLRTRRGKVEHSGPTDFESVNKRITELDVECWGEQHEREHTFTQNKVLDRKAQAYREGVLVGTAGHEVVERAKAKIKSELAGSLRRDRQEIKVLAAKHGGKLPGRDDLHGKKAFCCDQSFTCKLIRWGLEPVPYLWQCDVIVCNDIGVSALASERVWVASLLGCYVMMPGVLDGSTSDSCIKYIAAVGCKRRLHISEKFQTKHPRTSGQQWLDILCKPPSAQEKVIEVVVQMVGKGASQISDEMNFLSWGVCVCLRGQ